MKKLFSLLAALLICFSITACGSNDERSDDTFGKEAQNFADTVSDKEFATLSEYLDSQNLSEVKKQYQGLMDFDLLVEQNNVVFECKYCVQIPVDTSYSDEIFDQSFSSLAYAGVNMAKDIEEKVDVQNPSVIIRLLNDDGTLIYERAYKSTDTIDENATMQTKFRTVQEYIDSPTAKASIEASLNQLENSDISAEVKAEGNSLVYEYTFKYHLDSDTVKEMEDTLIAEEPSQKETFEYILSALNTVIVSGNANLIVRYCNDDGTVIHEKIYK